MYFQLGFPSRYTLECTPDGYKEADELIRKFNGKTKVFRSIYNYDGLPSAQTAVIDKIFFDFDYDPEDETKAQDDLRKLHSYLVREEYEHSMYFSGNGFHLFLKVDSKHARELLNPAGALRDAHKHICDTVGIEPDSVTKDLMRFARLPNTVNLRTGLFCIPLSSNVVMNSSRSMIMEYAKEQRTEKYIISGKPFDITSFDRLESEIEYAEPAELDENATIHDIDVFLSVPQCVANSLQNGDCGWSERFSIIVALRDLGYSRKETKGILGRHLDSKKFYHCTKEEDQINYLYDRQDLLFPACMTIRDDGYCVKGCTGHDLYIE